VRKRVKRPARPCLGNPPAGLRGLPQGGIHVIRSHPHLHADERDANVGDRRRRRRLPSRTSSLASSRCRRCSVGLRGWGRSQGELPPDTGERLREPVQTSATPPWLRSTVRIAARPACFLAVRLMVWLVELLLVREELVAVRFLRPLLRRATLVLPSVCSRLLPFVAHGAEISAGLLLIRTSAARPYAHISDS
jgi:hypothetical protein